MNKNIKFEHVTELLGHENFNDFENEYDDDIFYADGDKESVLESLDDCEIDLTSHLDFYYFDDWAIALYKF